MPNIILFFLMLPVIEIFAFIRVAQWIGFFPALLLCILSSLIGAGLIRQQGWQTLFAARAQMMQRQPVDQHIFDGVCLALAGMLFAFPGFVSDALACLLLIPEVRKRLRARLGIYRPRNPPPYGEVIEGEYERIETRDAE